MPAVSKSKAVSKSERVAAHRQRMKEQGLHSLTVWIDQETLSLLKQLERERRLTKGEVVSHAVKAFAETPTAPPKDIKSIVREIVREELTSQKPAQSDKEKPSRKPVDKSPSVAKKKPVGGAEPQVMAQIKELRGQNLSLQKIADQLNEDGIPTRSGKGKWQKGAVGVLVKQIQKQEG